MIMHDQASTFRKLLLSSAAPTLPRHASPVWRCNSGSDYSSTSMMSTAAPSSRCGFFQSLTVHLFGPRAGSRRARSPAEMWPARARAMSANAWKRALRTGRSLSVRKVSKNGLSRENSL
ncbi:hypothetical protein PV11_04287 [Exophiala sideris]|uniref:Uncharacterized protein n=1 Tax=Exophiala sideris TaxID=1016849 RepID=A0A0D1YM57_9EURO|nr:hypothetical protein PV11_04287 [Exophiala sideris]